MCGIAALFDPGRWFDPELLAAIDDDLYHRGPDSGGAAVDAGWAMVFRRLAILDPTPAADQPMTDAEQRLTLVYNGEIYNYRQLRAELMAAGVNFRTDGDTEVLLEGYRHWGKRILERIEGMFAFVLIDRREGIALAARDPLGIKPLYMARQGSLIAFASEARPLHRLIPARVDEGALAELVTFGWAAGRLSNYKSVERVPGGTLVTVPLSGGKAMEVRYCDPLDTLAPKEVLASSNVEEHVQEALELSVSAHLASDVGYTVQLSGGVDSSLISALAAARSKNEIASFSVSLGQHAYDESPYQRAVAAQYKLNHHDIRFTASDYSEALPRAVHHMEGPTPHGGCVMLMLLCDEIRKHSKVVLTGEGADEMFGGYERYKNWRKLMWQERFSKVLPTTLLPSCWPFKGMRRLGSLDVAAYAGVYHDFRFVQRIFPDLVPVPGARESASNRFNNFLDRLFAVDQTSYLESLLVRQDKMSMAASVEARVPFVHLPVLKVVNQLPHSLRAPGGITKPLLKRIAGKFLPTDLVQRRKIGLWLPYHEWFSQGGDASHHLETLVDDGSRLANYADRSNLRSVVEAFRKKGDRHAGLLLQRLVEVELWLRSITSRASQ
jgi:asparagine synthase (glutamine-hydrolysing)